MYYIKFLVKQDNLSPLSCILCIFRKKEILNGSANVPTLTGNNFLSTL